MIISVSLVLCSVMKVVNSVVIFIGTLYLLHSLLKRESIWSCEGTQLSYTENSV